jgi:hypothetical protein
VAGDRKKLARRYRIKRGLLGSLQVIDSAGTASIDRFYFDSSNRLCLDVLGTTRLVTEAAHYLRDPSAWYVDIGFEIDVANGTAANRAKILIDGVEVAAYSTDSRASIANTDTNWNNTVIHYLCRDNAGNYFDGYLAEPIGIDGSVTVAAYSSVDANQISTPVSPSATYGTTGFYLNFLDGASLTTLGYDRSGNGNNWTCNNISITAGVTYDWTVDTPTNNHATLNPAYPSAANISYANLRSGTTAARATMDAGAFSTPYWEVTAAGSAVTAGVISETGTTNTITVTANKVFGFRLASGALDYRNVTDAGAWTSITTGLTGKQFPYGITQAADWNFGQLPFVGVPSGSAMCTANLPSATIPDGTTAFVATTNSGANIQTALASLRSSWGADAYIEIFKRLESTEGWRWRFSSDTANYMDTSSTAAKTTFPSLTGTSYIAYALRCNPAYGMATGTVSHVNGVADTINDGLSNSRKTIILKNEASGTWYLYHPDLTAGKLIYLNEYTVEATNASISTVLSGSFVVAAALATGTYRWVSLAETSGFLALFKYTGNGSTDGPNINNALSASLLLMKAISIGDHATLIDSVRSPYNVAGSLIYLNLTNAESTGNTSIDMLGGSIKHRSTASQLNTLSATYIGIAFAEHPFGGANVAPAPAR